LCESFLTNIITN